MQGPAVSEGSSDKIVIAFLRYLARTGGFCSDVSSRDV